MYQWKISWRVGEEEEEGEEGEGDDKTSSAEQVNLIILIMVYDFSDVDQFMLQVSYDHEIL